ncbi:MaoC family dehydratase [Maritimibacter dapengensis]|uniref:MaoC family dehydratase n=1 Tax=Maritimibacter dapengensis TaxID=2836868 RepID=A0ABS6T015_9RHOB|nr:MaoC family dehydratase [Maritimibacter dapengensis]MBV7378583.1 MaoC family dehydratase [Maritimibacter dapengensis]
MSKYFEELPVGFTYRTDEAELTRDAILAFAREWDPQPFHLDEAAARESHFGSLIASGWHTLLIAFNLAMQAGVWDESSMGASGMDEVRWFAPARPGDRIHVRAEVIEAALSKSRPDFGRVRFRYDVHRADGEKIASYIGNHLIKARR